uniref:Uncharacterized protein n=1 Tax=Nelumbo nucifera TaxID=4432 RepID=A0A822Z830_NELNU|nr:TPA_asm: hypothetical protein HUJ06_013958 [Nelumbo nucifera]
MFYQNGWNVVGICGLFIDLLSLNSVTGTIVLIPNKASDLRRTGLSTTTCKIVA